MDDIFVWAGIGLGLLTMAIYAFIFWPKIVAADVFAGSSIMGGCVGFASGVKVCFYSVLYAKVPPIKDISVASFLGGFALCLVGLYTVYHRFKYRQ
jgi:hypothetical protein